MMRLLLAELLNPTQVDLNIVDDAVSGIDGTTVMDCKTLWDGLCKSENAKLGMANKRSAIECMECRQRMERSKVNVRWVGSDHQLADGLTKPSAKEHLIRKLKLGYIRLIFDERFTSAKKKK